MFLGNLLDEEGAIWFPLEFGTPFDAIRAVLFWVSVLYIAVGLILLIAIRGEGRKKIPARGRHRHRHLYGGAVPGIPRPRLY